MKALLLISYNQPYSIASSTPSTPSAVHSPPSPFQNILEEKPLFANALSIAPSQAISVVDFLEVRVEGESAAAATVFRGINETIEMMCQKRYLLELVDAQTPCHHCLSARLDPPTMFSMRDCEILAASGVTTIDCVRKAKAGTGRTAEEVIYFNSYFYCVNKL